MTYFDAASLRRSPSHQIPVWQTTRFAIDLTAPVVMGIVNLTPDSFSDGGRHNDVRAALRHAESLLRDGAQILDFGAESTRPGSPAVPLEEELQRLLPVLQEAVRLNVPISIDTYKPQVMQAALELGADIINDIWALRQQGALDVIAQHEKCGICLMHMHRDPQTMQMVPMQGDVVAQVEAFLKAQAQALLGRGVASQRVVLDPGIGFGKTVEQNFALLARQALLLEMGYPILAGWSRKSSIGAVTDQEVQHRMVGSVAAAVLAVDRGARVVRVHDVRATVDALRVWQAMSAETTGTCQVST